MKRFLIILLSSLVAVSAAGAQVERPENELAEIERRLKERRGEETRLRDEASAREKEVAALSQRMIETAEALQQAERRIAEIKRDVERLEGEETELETTLTKQRESLSEVLAALQSIERSRPPALLVSPEDASKAARTAMLLADVTPQIEARAALLKTALDDLAEVKADLEEERTKAEKPMRKSPPAARCLPNCWPKNRASVASPGASPPPRRARPQRSPLAPPISATSSAALKGSPASSPRD